MSASVSTAHVAMYRDSVVHLAQQQRSKLYNHVEVKNQVGKRAYFDRIGEVTMTEVTSRRQPTALSDTPHTRRAVDMKSFAWADTVAEEDIIRMLENAKSEYVIAAAKAWGRKIDDLIIASFNASAIEGESGGTTTAFPAGQVIVHGSAGMTFAKLRGGLKILENNDVDIESEPPILVLGPEEMDDLRADTTFTNAEQYVKFYTLDKATISGMVGPLGIRYIVSTRLPISGTTRSCFLYTKPCMYFNVGMDMKVSVSQRNDLNDEWQILVKGSGNAIRMDDDCVVEIQATE